jgi:SagB-type dehydrogenase family enzyme
MALQLPSLLLSAFLLTSLLAGGDALKLPAPPSEGMSLAEALKLRRSCRAFGPSGPSLAQAAALLWAGQGTNRADGRRTVASAGGTFPLELYLVTEGSRDLPRGTYHYLPATHQLVHLDDRGVGGCFREVALQNWVKSAPAIVVVAAATARTAARYGERAPRYVQLEAGACAHSLALQAAALGLGSGVAGAFEDAAVKRSLGLNQEEAPILLIPLGVPRD